MQPSPDIPSKTLVVGDRQRFCEIIAAILRSGGFAAESTTSLAHAIGRLRRERFELLFVDLDTHLQEANNVNLAAALIVTARLNQPDIRVVVVSGRSGRAEHQADAVLAKPFSYRRVLGVARGTDESNRSVEADNSVPPRRSPG